MAPKSSLNIRLTESVVFLRGSAETTVTGRRATRDAPPAMLRGLLALSLDKPTKISSIEITLEGKSVVTRVRVLTLWLTDVLNALGAGPES